MADGVDIDIYADDLDKDFNQTQVSSFLPWRKVDFSDLVSFTELRRKSLVARELTFMMMLLQPHQMNRM